MAFRWLPYTYTFCGCTKKFKIVSVFIAIYSMIRTIPSVYFFNNPYCPDDGYRKSGLGFGEHILGGVLLTIGMTFCIVSILLIFDIYCCRFGIPELYIIGVALVVPLTICYWSVYMVLFQTQLETSCRRKHAELTIGMLCLASLVDGVLLCYFALIVNSQDEFRYDTEIFNKI